MKKTLAILFVGAATVFCGQTARAEEQLALVPQPMRMERKTGEFVLNKDAAILIDKDLADAAAVGKQLAERIKRSTGFNLTVTEQYRSSLQNEHAGI